MLVNKNPEPYLAKTASIMSDVAVLAATTKTTLLGIAKQAHALGTGLQQAAPMGMSNNSNQSIEYLIEISDKLTQIAEEFGDFM